MAAVAEPKDLRTHIEHLIERTQDEILEASRELAEGISKETGRFVPPLSADIEQLIDNVFDFAERVMKGQRRMVNDVVRAINEQADRAAGVGRTTARKTVKRVTAVGSTVAERVPAKKRAAKKRVSKKSSPRKRAPRKAAATKAVAGR